VRQGATATAERRAWQTTTEAPMIELERGEGRKVNPSGTSNL
jgi:hypothetical protein